jgi:hypothetical protein
MLGGIPLRRQARVHHSKRDSAWKPEQTHCQDTLEFALMGAADD